MPRDLKKDLEICSKATRGPWYIGPKEGVPNRLIATTSLFGSAKIYTRGQDASPKNDTEFIAEARTGWPQAIKRAMESEAKVKELERKIYELTTAVNMYHCTKERAVKAEALNKELLDCLLKVILETCKRGNGEYDSFGIAAYADAMKLLYINGKIHTIKSNAGRIIAVNRKEQA